MNRTTLRIGGIVLACGSAFCGVAALTHGQAADKPVVESSERAQVEQQLAEVRRLMQQGQLIEAEALLEKAESSDVRFPLLHFGDNPTKVRRDFDRLKSSGKSDVDRSSTPADRGRTSPADPFANGSRQSTDVAGVLGGVDNPFRAAPADQDVANDSPMHVAVPGESAPAASRSQQATAAMLDARRALSLGDIARAQQKLQEVQSLGVALEGAHDSPEQLSDAIRQGMAMVDLKAANPEAWRQSYAEFLLLQADGLLGYGDMEAAARAATEAGQLNPIAEIRGISPELIHQRIVAMRTNEKTSDSAQAVPPAPGNPSFGINQVANLTPQADSLHPSTPQPMDNTPALALQEVTPASAQLPVVPQRPLTSEPQEQDAGPGDLGIRPAQASLTNDASAPLPLPATEIEEDSSNAAELLRQGEQALRQRNRNAAYEFFLQANEIRDQLDLLSQQRLQSHLQMLSVGSSVQSPSSTPRDPSPPLVDAIAADSSLLATQLATEIGKRQSEAAKIRQEDPRRSLEILRESQQLVERSQLDEGRKRQLQSRLRLSISETESYIREHQSEIELDEANRAILEEIDREREVNLKIQQQIAELVDQYNKLVDEHRYAESQVIADRLYELAPDDLVAQQVNHQAKMIYRENLAREIRDEGEEGNFNTLIGINRTTAEAAQGATQDIQYPDNWLDFEGRKGSSELNSRRTPRELEIERKLRMDIMPEYTDVPLAQVVESLSQLTGVNIVLDPLGLSQEAVRPDTLVTFPKLQNEISLKSALQIILEPLHLTYMIKDEVLRITSEQIRDGDLYSIVYNVADLVVPIPNFVPSNNVGLQGMINDALHVNGVGPMGGVAGPMSVVHGSKPGEFLSPNSQTALAQQMGGGGGLSPVNSGFMQPGNPGPLGGGANADFDSLIDLIISTVEYDSWMENGTGEGDIQEFPTNLSLVISQTQRVHEQIADLLEQLRRLQDLQVTIEVRFIRLTDNFFERIGIDFDFNIEDGTGLPNTANGGIGTPGALTPGAVFEPRRSSATVGIELEPNAASFPSYTVDLDIPFRQGTFSLSQPQFGGFDPAAGANFGFAILSDIEAFFLINAAQGDQRSNVLQAPKVTLFNGQFATVIDAAQVPFVISVVPVVGEFAAAQQPVIVVLSEGTLMSVQAVVSDDRKYVRLTLLPFFSEIGNVSEFTFEGSETSTTSSATTDDNDDGVNNSDENATTTVRSGTTVQLPTFQIISVSTTVSVPDGGTVLLGGIKRMREGRNEFGVPLLSKIPYVDRLFRNVGIGRTSESLMMMVTPHIIIQEEEEERLVGGL